MATDDDALLARLRGLATQVDPVPDDVVLAGRSAFAYRDLDVRLAELVEDAAPVGAGTRGEDDDTWFTFEVDEVVIEVAVRVRGGVQQLVGQVDGAHVAALLVAHADGEASPEVDDLGRFSCPISPGPVRVVVELDDGPRIATSWVVAPRP